MTYEEFVAARLPALVRFASVLTGDRALAEDVVQEVLARTHVRWRKIAQLDQPDSYVRRMVVNEYLSWRRRWARYVPHADAGQETLPDVAVQHAEQYAERDALRAELARLPRRQRTVLVLRYYLGFSDNEIADVLGCTPGTVRGYASRALSTLRIRQRATALAATHADRG